MQVVWHETKNRAEIVVLRDLLEQSNEDIDDSCLDKEVLPTANAQCEGRRNSPLIVVSGQTMMFRTHFLVGLNRARAEATRDYMPEQ